jgi:hypothetical protein
MSNKARKSQLHLATLVIATLGSKIIDVGELRISKTTLGKRGGDRFLIYLPMNRNYLWRLLHDLNTKVRVYIEIPKISEEESVEKSG